MVEGARLESVCTPKGYRGFESPSLRMIINVSIGDFIDKISILEIKRKKITDPLKLVNVEKEYRYLIDKISEVDPAIQATEEYILLVKANETIWDCEEEFRKIEKTELFDERFIRIARTIHSTNDLRADLKKKINLKYGSDLIEEKSHRP